MTRPSLMGKKVDFSSISLAEDSDKKDPTPMEVADTTMAMIPAMIN